MRKIILIGLAMGVSLYLWLRREAKEPAPTKKEAVIQDSVRVPEAPESMVSQAPKMVVAPLAEPPKPAVEKVVQPHNPPPGFLEFEIKEGLAVMQGDMVLGKPEEGQKIERGMTQAKRTRLWETNRIPYTIQDGVKQKDLILAAFDVFRETSPVQFVPFNGEKDSLVFVNSEDLCASYLGRVGGAQPIYLASSCGVNEIVHELMHALGFVHEHSRPDRDKYLEVLWQNIDPKYWLQFWIMPDDLVHDYVGSVFSFDGESIMLYDPNAFALGEGLKTLKSRTGVNLSPSRGRLSRTDQERLLYLYGR